jgi:hypothetical protein
MEDNLKKILEEFEKLKGQFIITQLNQIERLVAIGDDSEDWYYITYNGRELHWISCVGRIMPLKGYLREEDYSEIVRLAKLNHSDQLYLNDGKSKLFFDEVDRKISTYDKNHSFLTDFCWDLN